MINRGTFDRLEDAVDRFEETWSPESHSKIEELLREFRLSDDDEAIVELIRIDIELRYERGLSIELADYLKRFDILHERPERVAEIAFEDYRSRSANGRSLSPTRWSDLPGVNRELWFQELAHETSAQRMRRRITVPEDDSIVSAALESELQAIGFQLIQKIGEGAFSQVYLACQSELADRFVVLKIVTDSLSEPEYMALLQHTNIVPIYSFHRILSRSIICMPYAGCVTLDDFLKSKAEATARGGQSLVQTVQERLVDTKMASADRPEKDRPLMERPGIHGVQGIAATHPLKAFESLDCGELAIWIFQRLAAALDHAHARGVLHNDLKPSNVLIRNDGEPALLDFNLSESLSQTTLRRAGGTLPYMAPETYRSMMGQETRPCAASDLYGLGVIFFQFVTGRLPYPTPASIAAVDLASAIEARREPPDWQTNDTVDPGLKAMIDRCLAFDAEDRYASADELQFDLQREQQSLNLANTAEPLRWKTRKWVRRHPRAIASGLVAAVMLAVLLPLAYTTMTSIKTNRALRSVAASTAFTETSSDYLSTLMADPNRQRDANVAKGVAILDSYGLLDRAGVQALLSPLDPDRRETVRDALLRHLIHIAILETQHRSQLRNSDPVASQDVRRLDRLIQAVKWVEVGQPSRARLFLESERAQLSGHEQRYELLRKNAAQTLAQSDSELYLEAVRLLAKNDPFGASELLASLADRNSVPPALRWTMLGRAQYIDRRIEDAKLSFTQSIARAPDSAKLRVLKGRCHFELGQYLLAKQDYEKAIELDSNNVAAWSQLGLLHHAAGKRLSADNRDLDAGRKFEQALRCYDRAAELAPGQLWTLIKRSHTYEALGKADLADADYQAVMDAECDDANELYYRAEARKDTEPEAALDDLRRAYQLDPDRIFLLQETAFVLARKLDRHDEAIELYARVLAVQPRNEFAGVERALSLVRQQRTVEALEQLKKAMQEPNTARSFYQAACVHALIGKQRNQQRAVTLLAKAIHQGYAPKDLDDDPDLESIRNREDFRVVDQFLKSARRDQQPDAANETQPDVPTSLSPF